MKSTDFSSLHRSRSAMPAFSEASFSPNFDEKTRAYSPLPQRKVSSNTTHPPRRSGLVQALEKVVDMPERARSATPRFSPMQSRKVTALAQHESESDYSPSRSASLRRSKPHAMKPSPPPKAFQSTAKLMKDLGIENSNVYHKDVTNAMGNQTTMPSASFRLPRDVPDLSTLLSSQRKPTSNYKTIESIPISTDDQKLLSLLQNLQGNIQDLESRNMTAEARMRDLSSQLSQTRNMYTQERQRAQFAEDELKAKLKTSNASLSIENELFSAKSEIMRLGSIMSSLKTKCDTLEQELEQAKENIKAVEEERDEAISRLANALGQIDRLTAENADLKGEISVLTTQAKANHSISDCTARVREQDLLKKAEQSKEVDKRSVQSRIDGRVAKEQQKVPREAGRTLKTKKVEEVSDYDEGIERSTAMSILDDEEIAELTSEIEEIRRKGHTAAKAALKKEKVKARSPEIEREKSRKDASQTKDSQRRPKAAQSRSTSAPIVLGQRSRRTRVQDFSEDEESLVSLSDESDDDTYEEGTEDLEFLSTDDEPSRVLRRKYKSKSASLQKVNVQKIIDELASHNPASCTVCTRKRQKAEGASNRPSQALPQPQVYGSGQTRSRIVPVSERQDVRSVSSGREGRWEEEATLRPSVKPELALTTVLAQLEDEFRHLKLQYTDSITAYEVLDPSLSKRKRKVLAANLRQIIEDLEGKADQIYALYDVLEVAKDGVMEKKPNRRPWLNPA